MQRFHYVFPSCPNFREKRPDLCWEHMYGWIDGYGVLFDPALQQSIQTIPEWHIGPPKNIEPNDVVITSCQQASALLNEYRNRGIYVRPRAGIEIERANITSEKETLITPAGDIYYPSGLPYDRYSDNNTQWRLGEVSAVATSNRRVAVGFELFSMLASLLNEWPEHRLIFGADLVRSLFCEIDSAPRDKSTYSNFQQQTRLDFQAYGINRLLMQWLADLKNQPHTVVANADAHFTVAVNAWHENDEPTARIALTSAFAALAETRRTMSALELHFIEVPHMGILLKEKGFFELEWPAFARQTLTDYLENATKYGYRLSLEAGAHCWRNLALRYPRLIQRITDAWNRGEISLTNGTFSLPFALLSPLALQYMQLQKGREVFEQVFGRAPKTYQCQENSLTAQMPELLRHFGYNLALHLAQNHGQTPDEPTNYILWRSHAGCAIPALATRMRELSQKGNNFYLDLPMVHHQLTDETEPINYFNFQDLGYMPFRAQMVRAHHYAPIWGEFATPESRHADERNPKNATPRSYDADAYSFSSASFYGDSTNANALSHGELILTLNSRWRQAQLTAFGTPHWEQIQAMLAKAAESLCLLESHDAVIVQDQRRGEFFASMTMTTPPYHRETLGDEIRHHVKRIEDILDEACRLTKGDRLLNACNASLPLARICGNGPPLAGPFARWSLSDPQPANITPEFLDLPIVVGQWRLAVTDDVLTVICSEQTVHIRLVDQPFGRFLIKSATARQSSSLIALEIHWIADTTPAQTVIMEAVLSPEHRFMELNLQYAPGRSFASAKRWEDYLAVHVDFGTSLEDVWRFNPNVQSRTTENRVLSPWFLAVRSSDQWISLLNQGASVYEIDRLDGYARWLFHVADETIWRRSMAIAFDTRNGFELARGWTQGLIHATAAPQLPALPDSIAIEAFVDDSTLLVSNLHRQSVRFNLDTTFDLDIMRMTGGSAIVAQREDSVTVELGACEMALVRFGPTASHSHTMTRRGFKNRTPLMPTGGKAQARILDKTTAISID